MSERSDGGAAFPSKWTANDQSENCQDAPERILGLTTRDYFAGQALTGMMANPATPKGCMEAAARIGLEAVQVIAQDCYLLADAMIEARSK